MTILLSSWEVGRYRGNTCTNFISLIQEYLHSFWECHLTRIISIDGISLGAQNSMDEVVYFPLDLQFGRCQALALL